MKFERIGLFYISVLALCAVILIPLVMAIIPPFMKITADGMSTMLDFFVVGDSVSNTELFSRGLVYSFTISFIIFIGIGTLIQNRKARLNKNYYDDNDSLDI